MKLRDDTLQKIYNFSRVTRKYLEAVMKRLIVATILLLGVNMAHGEEFFLAKDRATADFTIMKQNYTIVFHNETGRVGTLDFNGDKMVFTGAADESAKIFMGWLAEHFSERLAEERKRCVQILK